MKFAQQVASYYLQIQIVVDSVSEHINLMITHPILKVAVVTLLLMGCYCNVLQVSVEPSASSSSGIDRSYCTLTSVQSQSAINREYFQQIKALIPQSGQHFLSNMALLFKGEPNDDAKKMSLLQNLNFMRYVSFAIFGLIILIFFVIQAAIRITFQGNSKNPSERFYHLKIVLSIIGIVGLALCFAYITNYSFEGIKENAKIKEGLEHFACTNNLLNTVHTVDGKDYAVSDIPDIFFRMEEAISRIRLKNNRILHYSDEILQNAGRLSQLKDRASSLFKSKQQISKDPKNQKFIQQLKQFTSIYENMREAQTHDVSKFPIFEHIIKAREELVPYKNSMLHAREVTRTSVDFIQDFVSAPSVSSMTQWLKFLYVFFIVVGAYSLANVYFIVLRKTNNIKKMVVYVIAAACFIAFVISLVLSIAVPYFVWGCEGSNYTLANDNNLKNELERSRVHDETKKALAIFGPQSKFKLPSIINRERLVSFQTLLDSTKAFIDAKEQGQKIVKQLKQYYLKYDGQTQINKVNGVIAALQDKNIESINLLYLQAVEVASLLNQSNGLFGSLNPAMVGKALQRNVDSLCIPNFNSLYETREKMIGIAYALLLSLFFILLVTGFPKVRESAKLDKLQESRLQVMKYAMEQNTADIEDVEEPSGKKSQRESERQ